MTEIPFYRQQSVRKTNRHTRQKRQKRGHYDIHLITIKTSNHANKEKQNETRKKDYQKRTARIPLKNIAQQR